jgi:large subunit ribosomal protein L22
MPHKGAKLIRKTVKSAASNALADNKKLDEDMLYVKEIYIDDGPRLKRVWFRGRGRADMQVKRMCHVTVVVDETSTSANVAADAKQSSTPSAAKEVKPSKKAAK